MRLGIWWAPVWLQRRRKVISGQKIDDCKGGNLKRLVPGEVGWSVRVLSVHDEICLAALQYLSFFEGGERRMYDWCMGQTNRHILSRSASREMMLEACLLHTHVYASNVSADYYFFIRDVTEPLNMEESPRPGQCVQTISCAKNWPRDCGIRFRHYRLVRADALLQGASACTDRRRVERRVSSPRSPLSISRGTSRRRAAVRGPLWSWPELIEPRSAARQSDRRSARRELSGPGNTFVRASALEFERWSLAGTIHRKLTDWL